MVEVDEYLEEIFVQDIPVHKCNREELASFYPPSFLIEDEVERLKEQQFFYCMDNYDIDGEPVDLEFFGYPT